MKYVRQLFELFDDILITNRCCECAQFNVCLPMILIHIVMWITFNKCIYITRQCYVFVYWCVRKNDLLYMKYLVCVRTVHYGAIAACFFCILCASKQIKTDTHSHSFTRSFKHTHPPHFVCVLKWLVICNRTLLAFFVVHVTLKIFGHEPIFELFSSFYRVTWFVYRGVMIVATNKC